MIKSKTLKIHIHIYKPDDKCNCYQNAIAFLHKHLIEPSIGIDDDGVHFLEFNMPEKQEDFQKLIGEMGDLLEIR